MKLIFVGPPGGGKGTQARLLQARRAIPQIATGDILREAIAQDTALGRDARRYMEAGELVPDAVMIAIVEERLRRPDAYEGFVLDGFPRTLPQAEALEETLNRMQRRIDRAVDFQIREEVLIRRLSGRRVCQVGGHIYHLEYQPPREAGLCDIDHSPLSQREDDRPEAIRRRMEVYQVETLPVLAFYQALSVYAPLDAEGEVEAVYDRLLGVVNRR